jgi:hypothetical protein
VISLCCALPANWQQHKQPQQQQQQQTQHMLDLHLTPGCLMELCSCR